MSELVKYWPIALFALNALATWACWSLRQMAKNEIGEKTAEMAGRHDDLADKVAGHSERITRAEDRMAELVRDIEQLPTKADLARLEGEVKGVSREVGAANAGIRRIEGYLLERGLERT